MPIEFSHPQGAQIKAASQQWDRHFDNAKRLAESGSLSGVLHEIAQGLRSMVRMLRLYSETANALYPAVEAHFTQAAHAARRGHERHSLEALANGLIGFNKAIQLDQAQQGRAGSLSPSHFSEALCLARSGRQRPVLAKFAAGLQHSAHALLGSTTPAGNPKQWMRDWAISNFKDAVQFAQSGRQRPTLKALALGLSQFAEGIHQGMSIYKGVVPS